MVKAPATVFIFYSFVIELFGESAMLRPVKRNSIETVETADGARAARLNPVEVEIIHLFVQLSRAGPAAFGGRDIWASFYFTQAHAAG